MTDLLQAVEAYLAQTGMAPTAFGDGALNDRHFVRQLRKGRRTFRDTEDRVRKFMAANPPVDTETAQATSPGNNGENSPQSVELGA
ncbi:hypothetical protein [Sphingobium sp. S6]|uniref:hypothetical protein n=1 Tax=Sphingobium sp. S6 TaxID=2758386 RepID=UPI001F3859A7|nr:hypothetical protein [Sphingobium sp. S6]